MTRVMDYLPRGDMVDDAAWQRRHRFLLIVLLVVAPSLAVFGLAVGASGLVTALIALIPLAAAAGGWFVPGRHAGSLVVTAGLTASCAGLVILSGGYIEAHFSFFVIIGFLTLYQYWVPFVFNIVFTTLSHGLGTLLVPTLMFNHHAAQHSPWVWSLIHGFAVLLACIGVAIFCKITEDEQRRRGALTKELHDARVRQQEFTSELLLNLARRNQSMFHRQLDIINDLEERERDPDALADLFRLDHLATRVRRNAESLLVLSGEQPARVWSAPVALRDVVRAGVAETEDLDRVTLVVDERPRIVGSTVADLTHIIAELVENAARYSPPSAPVVIQSRAYHRAPGAHLLVIEDTGIGMPPAELTAANELLADPQEVDVSAAARRLGFHVVSRLAERHGIEVSLTPTPGCGLTAVLMLPAALFAETTPTAPGGGDRSFQRVPASAVPVPRRGSADTGEHTPAYGNGTGNGTGALPAPPVSGPIPVDGRHAWPGRDDPARPDGDPFADDTGERPRRPAHAAPGADDADDAEPAAIPGPLGADGTGPHGTGAHGTSPHGTGTDGTGMDGTGTDGADAGAAAVVGAGDAHDTVEDVPAPDVSGAIPAARRGLIHPIVVPPPAASDEGGPAPTPTPTSIPTPTPAPAAASAPAPTWGAAPEAPTPRRSDEDAPAVVGPHGLVLARRRPQTHLAPELIRRTPSIPAATVSHAARSVPPVGGNGHAGPGGNGHGGPVGNAHGGNGRGDRGAMDALSAYQASRAAARSAMGGADGGRPSGPDPDHHPQRGRTPGRQT
ncbi:sensor histidine kinase [Actinomycetospora lemnae]|uniref:histidine kinase n=1 Tax=Actinomycetospora lemnae TaxID=3019891 RepID=A0ABT5SPV0_9PSEU|nr:ATP-binding protein [Actinomycetospora sp. DW7H6]MDD7964867.1 ATP-binding protein [Actinomycetospora sp. DW7H6]